MASASYRPHDEILETIKSRTFVGLMGPAGAGKSTTGDLIIAQDTDFGRTGSVGTRRPEARDNPAFYRQISLKEANDHIQNRTFVNYVIHPTTGNIYATTVDMYSKPYTMLENLPETVPYFSNLGFKAVHFIYIVTQATTWQTIFNARYPEKNNERIKRLAEAENNLKWALSPEAEQYNVIFIYNAPNKQAETAKKIINIVKYNQPEDKEGRIYAQAMLAQIEEMK